MTGYRYTKGKDSITHFAYLFFSSRSLIPVLCSMVNFNGEVVQTIHDFDFYYLIVNNAGIKQIPGSTTVSCAPYLSRTMPALRSTPMAAKTGCTRLMLLILFFNVILISDRDHANLKVRPLYSQNGSRACVQYVPDN